MSKRSKKENNSQEVDRLSDLPDDILQRILCFLETKEAIRTSVLSRKWRYLWIRVPALHLNSNSFSCLFSYNNFVCHVLRRCDGNSTIDTFRFSYEGNDKQLIDRVVNYVIDRKVNHLIFRIGWKGWGEMPFPCKLLQCQTLEKLQLNNLGFIESISFTKLTTLHLELCSFHPRDGCNSCDLLSSIPCLSNLCLLGCSFYGLKVFKISGPQLVKLTVKWRGGYQGRGPEDPCDVEISAPKLTFLSYKSSVREDFSLINLPSLQHADIHLCPQGIGVCYSRMKMAFVSFGKFFQGLSSAQFLTLSSSTIKALSKVLGLEHQPPPFSRLKSWKLERRPNDKSFLIPAKVLTYLGCPES